MRTMNVFFKIFLITITFFFTLSAYGGNPFWATVKPNLMIYLDTSTSMSVLNWNCDNCHVYQPGNGGTSQIEMARDILTGGNALSNAVSCTMDNRGACRNGQPGLLDEFKLVNYAFSQNGHNNGCAGIVVEGLDIPPNPYSPEADIKRDAKNLAVQKAIINGGSPNLSDGSFYSGDPSTNRSGSCNVDGNPPVCANMWGEGGEPFHCDIDGKCNSYAAGIYCNNYGTSCPGPSLSNGGCWWEECCSGCCGNNCTGSCNCQPCMQCMASATCDLIYSTGKCAWGDSAPGMCTGIYAALDAIEQNLRSKTMLDPYNWINAPAGYDKRSHQFCRENFVVMMTDGGEYGSGHSKEDVHNKIKQLFNINNRLDYIEAKVKTFVFQMQNPGVEIRDARSGSGQVDLWADYGDDGVENIIPRSMVALPSKDHATTRAFFIGVLNTLNAGNWGWAPPKVDEKTNFLIKSTFTIDRNPFNVLWHGQLTAHPLDPKTFELDESKIFWDAGKLLNDREHASRQIYTNVNGKLANLSSLSLDNNLRAFIQGDPCAKFINQQTRGNCSAQPGICESTNGCWKLGDIFHSKGALVGIPQNYANDTQYVDYLTHKVDCYQRPGRKCYVGGFTENSKDKVYARDMVYYVGANDGMLHAFLSAQWVQGDNPDTDNEKELGYYSPKPDDCPHCGNELWAFLPAQIAPQLDKLREQHDFFMDGNPVIRDVMFWGTPPCPVGSKDFCYRTVLVMGQGQGGRAYFALDITEPLNPKFLWEFTAYGKATSTPFIGYIKVGGKARAAAFFTTGDRAYKEFKGKRGLHIVDLQNGSNSSYRWFIGLDDKLIATDTLPNGGEFVSGTTGYDKNGDGYTDTVYFGNTDGRMYRVRFDDGDPSKTSDACEVFDPSRARHGYAKRNAIYTTPVLSTDYEGNILAFFGTGNPDPGEIYKQNIENYFWALKDNPYQTCEDLQNGKMQPITTCSEENNSDIKVAGRIDLDFARGEKVISNAKIRDSKVFFTTFLPDQHPCGLGESRLYSMDYTKCDAFLDNDNDGKLEKNEPLFTPLPKGIASEVALTEKRVFVQSSGSDAAGEQPKVTQIKSDLGVVYPQLMRWREVIP